MLGLPLTFALSQDQTLQLRCLNRTEFRRTAIWISSLLLFSLYRYSVFKDQQLRTRRTLLLYFVEPGDADYLFFSDCQLFFLRVCRFLFRCRISATRWMTLVILRTWSRMFFQKSHFFSDRPIAYCGSKLPDPDGCNSVVARHALASDNLGVWFSRQRM